MLVVLSISQQVLNIALTVLLKHFDIDTKHQSIIISLLAFSLILVDYCSLREQKGQSGPCLLPLIYFSYPPTCVLVHLVEFMHHA